MFARNKTIQIQFLTEFPNKNWTRGGLDKLIRKIDTLGTVRHLPGAGRPRSVRTAENISMVEELVLSQDDRPQTHRTQRQIGGSEADYRINNNIYLFFD